MTVISKGVYSHSLQPAYIHGAYFMPGKCRPEAGHEAIYCSPELHRENGMNNLGWQERLGGLVGGCGVSQVQGVWQVQGGDWWMYGKGCWVHRVGGLPGWEGCCGPKK